MEAAFRVPVSQHSVSSSCTEQTLLPCSKTSGHQLSLLHETPVSLSAVSPGARRFHHINDIKVMSTSFCMFVEN